VLCRRLASALEAALDLEGHDGGQTKRADGEGLAAEGRVAVCESGHPFARFDAAGVPRQDSPSTGLARWCHHRLVV